MSKLNKEINITLHFPSTKNSINLFSIYYSIYFPSTKNLIKLSSIYYITVFSLNFPRYHIAYSNILLLVLVQILRICEALLVLPPLLVDWSPAHKLIRPESSSKHYG